MAKKKSFQIGSALSNGLEETITAAHNHSGELRIDVIPLNRIETDPDNPRTLLITMLDVIDGINNSDKDYMRKKNELEALQSLANSIKDQGIINPVIVYKHGEKYRLIAGERRTLASLLAGKNDIQAKILDEKPNALKISILQWIENIERSDLSLWERLRNLEKIRLAYADKKRILPEEITVTELSHLIGCVKSQAMSYKAVLDADDVIKILIAENKIRNLEKAAFLAGVEASDIQQQAIAACVVGASLKKLKLIVSQAQAMQALKKKPTSNNGGQRTAVSLGVTKNVDVAKVILDSILSNSTLSHLKPYFKDIDRNSYKAISDAFKQLIKKLEELYA